MATRQLSPPLRPIDRIASGAVSLVTLMLYHADGGGFVSLYGERQC